MAQKHLPVFFIFKDLHIYSSKVVINPSISTLSIIPIAVKYDRTIKSSFSLSMQVDSGSVCANTKKLTAKGSWITTIPIVTIVCKGLFSSTFSLIMRAIYCYWADSSKLMTGCASIYGLSTSIRTLAVTSTVYLGRSWNIELFTTTLSRLIFYLQKGQEGLTFSFCLHE